ncbi:uncharacterized protein LOC132748361 isoform X2 [Ruditapes philippinarum]|uniref:uncharacterized protein LOC132748361 isoform X2 n=1 Tax=Ruditapes philippinarum TaxID=129788 RepID=UPI00295B91F1|nr:uncharacterized protein LOC132748361 isoform X2 [Ruditapes philippinarum]
MMSVEIDEDLREQSKLLLRKLKDKQSRLQQSFVSTSSTRDPSTYDNNGEQGQSSLSSVTMTKQARGERTKRSPVRRFGNNQDSNCRSNLTERMDTGLQKSVSNTPSREVRARLHRRRTQSREETDQADLKRGRNSNKENLVETSPKKSFQSKDLNVESQEYLSRDTNTELSNLRKDIEEVYMDDLKENAHHDSYAETAAKGSGTPNTLRRRRIIDQNVKVNGMANLNASELLKECEDEYPRLNYSYSNVEDSDLKFLQERLGTGTGVSDDDDIPVRDTDPISGEENYSKNLGNPGNSRKIAKFIKETKKPKSILLSTSNRSNRSTSGTSNTSRVSFRSPTRDASGSLTFQMDSISKQQQKMLGYDWIAALLDNDSNAINQSETFFEDLKEFRRLNLEECVNSMYMDSPQQLWEHPEREPLPVQKALEETKVKPYVVNNRLFPEPIKKSLFADYDYQEPDTSHVKEKEPTYDEPRFVRVSIPRSTLMPPHRVKPHRRNSFDGTDSMALSQHCLKGWNTTQPAMVPASSNIALRDATTGIKSSMKTTLSEAERLAANYPYHWDAAEQSICKPMPAPTYRPEAKYTDTIWPSVHTNTSAFSQSSQGLKQATDDLLNSTYSLMYEMKRLKMERSDDPIRL